MIQYHWHKMLQRLGYRKVWYYPSRTLPLTDFYRWHYRPDLPPAEYKA